MKPLVPGRRIGHYRLESLVGKGGMGLVYVAQDTRLRRLVAIKVLAPDRLDRASRDRLRTEALALSSLNHPNVASVYDFGCAAGVDYLVMEYVPGATLDELVRNGPLSSERVAQLGVQLARGLAAAHAADVIHRDIKPGNVRVTPEALVKILDFGVAVSPAATVCSKTTVVGTGALRALAGTLQYMAPERLRGAAADARTDIFSAGLVLYEMACGRLPFVDDQPIRLIESILHARMPAPRQLNPAIDPALELVILRALSADPARRYARASELAAALEPLERRQSSPPPRQPAMKKLTKWVGHLAGSLI
jgi:serine/threonine protein kinase